MFCMRYWDLNWGQGDIVMVDADEARHASGAWLAARSQPAAPPVADFLTVAAMPGPTLQVGPWSLACMRHFSVPDTRLQCVEVHQVGV